MPMFEKFNFQINRASFELIFPGGTVPGVDIPIRVTLKIDLGFEIGDRSGQARYGPVFEAELPGLTFIYPHPDGLIGDFKILWRSIWFETTATGLALGIRGYEFTISRIGLGFDIGSRATLTSSRLTRTCYSPTHWAALKFTACDSVGTTMASTSISRASEWRLRSPVLNWSAC